MKISRDIYLKNSRKIEQSGDLENEVNNLVVIGSSKTEIVNLVLEKIKLDKDFVDCWVEDQFIMFQAEIQRVQSIRNGFTHYIWKKEKCTRPSHTMNDKKVFSWNVGADNLTKPGTRHPGEDYLCRCKVENLTEKQAQELGYSPQASRGAASTKSLIDNYELW